MRIVAFVDRSLYAPSVIDHIGWLAGTSGAGIDLVQIISPNELAGVSMMPIHPGGLVVLNRDAKQLDDQVADLKRKARAQLEEARTVLTSLGISDTRVRVLEGNVSEVMVEAAAEAAAVVMGKRGEQADLARLPLGSNFERLVRSSQVPVLAVSRTFRPIHRMLIALDLDLAAERAVETVAEGLVPQMPVRLLHVGFSTDALQAALKHATARLVDAGFQVTAELVEGIPRVVVPERVVSEDIDLVAMGAFGSSRLTSLIFGSLTTELIRACQVPILLCR
jgi:nucleotide-binding universal stress UspA family protein